MGKSIPLSIVIMSALGLVSCGHTPKSSLLASLYARSARYHGLDRNPVILIPGLLGIPLEVGAYVNILGALGIGGYRDDSLGRAGEVDYGEDHFT